MDVGDDSTTSDGGLDQSVQLLVSPDGELEMSGGDSLHLQVLTGVAGQLEDLSREVLQDGGAVHGGGGSNSAAAEGPALQMTMDPRNVFHETKLFFLYARFSFLPSNRELQSSPGASRHGLLLRLSGIFSSFSSSHVELLSNLGFYLKKKLIMWCLSNPRVEPVHSPASPV